MSGSQAQRLLEDNEAFVNNDELQGKWECDPLPVLAVHTHTA